MNAEEKAMMQEIIDTGAQTVKDLQARCEELAKENVDIGALHLADEQSVRNISAEVESCHKNLKMLRESLATVGDQRDAAKEIAEDAKLQVEDLKQDKQFYRALLLRAGHNHDETLKGLEWSDQCGVCQMQARDRRGKDVYVRRPSTLKKREPLGTKQVTPYTGVQCKTCGSSFSGSPYEERCEDCGRVHELEDQVQSLVDALKALVKCGNRIIEVECQGKNYMVDLATCIRQTCQPELDKQAVSERGSDGVRP